MIIKLLHRSSSLFLENVLTGLSLKLNKLITPKNEIIKT